MGTGMGQGGIMGELQNRMESGSPGQQMVARMLHGGFGRATEGMADDSAARRLMYGRPAPTPTPTPTPQGIASVLPALQQPPQPVLAPTMGYGGMRR